MFKVGDIVRPLGREEARTLPDYDKMDFNLRLEMGIVPSKKFKVIGVSGDHIQLNLGEGADTRGWRASGFKLASKIERGDF